jgi:lysine 2,3-aminomutase
VHVLHEYPHTYIPSVERIRIDTRTLVSLFMRFTDDLVNILARYRRSGKRQIAIVTHVQSRYEISPEMIAAVDRLRKQGIPVYNQLFFTFFVSSRFEAANLRRLLTLVSIDSHHTFNTKGKEETLEYRVPNKNTSERRCTNPGLPIASGRHRGKYKRV